MLLSTLLIASGCEQPDGAVGSNIGTDQNGKTRVTAAAIEADTTYIAETISTGSSPYLYVGNAADLVSSALISFDAPLLPFLWKVDSVRLNLSYQGNIGDGRGITIVTELLNMIWDESEPPSWDSLNFDVGTDTSFGTITVDDDSNSVSVSLPISRVESWFNMIDSSRTDTSFSVLVTIPLDAPDQNPSLDQLVRFRSRGAIGDSLRPEMIVFMSVSDSIDGATYSDTLRFYPSKDAYVLKNHSNIVSKHLIIGSGVNFRSNLRFDLRLLWQAQEDFHIVVNRATITLHKVRNADQILPDLPAIWAYKLTDETGFSAPDSAPFAGFTFFPTAIDSALDTLQIIVTNPTGDWAKGLDSNFGVTLRSSTQGLDINHGEFYSSSSTDPALRPKLSIYYTELPR